MGSKKVKSEEDVKKTGQQFLIEDAYRFKTNRREEEIIQERICDELNRQFPDVMFLSDPSGIRVSIGLAKRIKRTRSNNFKIPDLVILEPRHGYCGLVLEIKKDREVLLKKNGELRKNEHQESQYKSLHHLYKKGYLALFGLGYEDTWNKILIYLTGDKKPIVKN